MNGRADMSLTRLAQPVTLQQPVLTPDGGGGFTPGWQDIASVFAEIAELAGAEIAGATRQTESLSPCRITILYRADVTPDMRITAADTAYSIVSVRDPDGARRWLEIIAEKT